MLKLSSIARYSFFFVALFVLFDCGGPDSSKKNGGAEDGEKEVQREKAKTDLVKKGRSIQKATFRALAGTLKEHLKKDGLEDALQYCSMNALAITDSLSRAHHVRIKRVTNKPRNPYNALSETEKPIFNDFRETIQKGKKPDPVVERADSANIFFSPIVIKKDLCLKCHGKKDVDITPEHYERIRELYPDGKAVGYEKGDLRGLWRIEFLEGKKG